MPLKITVNPAALDRPSKCDTLEKPKPSPLSDYGLPYRMEAATRMP
jgi:hypothetical protein